MQLGKNDEAMSKRHQLITITHLLRLRQKGDAHYYVYKDSAAEKT